MLTYGSESCPPPQKKKDGNMLRIIEKGEEEECVAPLRKMAYRDQSITMNFINYNMGQI
jgi:hypothetical protein